MMTWWRRSPGRPPKLANRGKRREIAASSTSNSALCGDYSVPAEPVARCLRITHPEAACRGGLPSSTANTPGIRHIAFAVEDIDAVVAGLRARGAELVGELERYKDSYRPNGSSPLSAAHQTTGRV